MRVQAELRHRVVYGGGQIAESIEECTVQVENEQFFLRDECLDFVEWSHGAKARNFVYSHHDV